MADRKMHVVAVVAPHGLRIAALAGCVAWLAACGGGVGEAANPLAGGAPVAAAPTASTAIKPPTLITAPQPLIVADGDSATFVVAAQGQHLHYRWSINGSVLPGLDSPVLRLAAALRADDGAQIAVVAFNEAGAVTPPPVRLSVESAGWRAPWE